MGYTPIISPQLAVRRGREAVAFYQAAFGAVEVHRVGGTDEDPSVVSQLTVGDAAFWVADGSKLGEVEVAKICELAEVSLVITDSSADPSILAELAAVECEVHVAADAR